MRVQAAQTVAQSEPIDGPTIRKYQELAARHSLWLSCGGFHERSTSKSTPTPAAAGSSDGGGGCGGESAEKVYNSHVLISPEGAVAQVYRKIHLFDVDIPNGWVIDSKGFTLCHP
jgi:predicted amidohydrolase